jgi:hypothetical protein
MREGGGVAAMSDDLKTRTLRWLESLRVVDAPYGTYRMSVSTDATTFSSCFAVSLRQLFDDLATLSDGERGEWIAMIQDRQDAQTGLFVEPWWRREDYASSHHNWDYITWQLTTFCTSALGALGGRPRHAMRFLDDWRDVDRIHRWLDGLNWRDPWLLGNIVMFLGICLIEDSELSGTAASRRAAEAVLDWHDRHVDARTGLWGTDRGADFGSALFGAMHQFILYYYTKRPVKHPQRIVDKTLLMQQRDGLFCAMGGGGGCEDLDAVETLVNMFLRTDYRREAIRRTLRRTMEALLTLELPSGGFLWARRRRFSVLDWSAVFFDVVRHRSFRYWKLCVKMALLGQMRFNEPRLPTGWVKTAIPADESDIFATWFRVLALAQISLIIDDPRIARRDWRFLEHVGLGYFDRALT